MSLVISIKRDPRFSWRVWIVFLHSDRAGNMRVTEDLTTNETWFLNYTLVRT